MDASPSLASTTSRALAADADPVAFVLGGTGGLRRRDRGALGTWLGVAVVAVLVAIPLRGLYRFTGGTMEEGFMLYFPELLGEGLVPNVDFLHLYGPGSLHALFGWYEVFGYSLPAERVIRVLEQVVAWRGRPQAIRLDNGPELIAERFMSWCAERGIELRYIQPGKPDQNAFIERFNRTYRTEVLNAYVFESLDQVREISAEWLQSYNEERPHDALAGLPPATYRAQLEARSSPLALSS